MSNQFTAHGYTVCTDEPLDEDERSALTAYLSMRRKATDCRRGVGNLDAPRPEQRTRTRPSSTPDLSPKGCALTGTGTAITPTTTCTHEPGMGTA